MRVLSVTAAPRTSLYVHFVNIHRAALLIVKIFAVMWCTTTTFWTFFCITADLRLTLSTINQHNHLLSS